MSDIKSSETITPSVIPETPASAAVTPAIEPSLLALSESRPEPLKDEAIKSETVTSETVPGETVIGEPIESDALASALNQIEANKPVEASRPIEAPRLAGARKPIELPMPELVAPLSMERPKAGPPQPIPPIMASQSAAPSRTHRFTAMAASVAFAAAVGSLVGALAFSVISRPEAASADPVAAALDLSQLQESIATLRNEVASMKTSVDGVARNSNTQFAKATERFERIERAQSASAAQVTKSIEAIERHGEPATEATGTVRPQPAAAVPAAAAPQAVEPLRGPLLDGWTVRNVIRNVAFIQGRRMGVIEVEPGDIVPGVGRIRSIRKHTDGRWVVVTSRGLITSR